MGGLRQADRDPHFRSNVKDVGEIQRYTCDGRETAILAVAASVNFTRPLQMHGSDIERAALHITAIADEANI